MHVGQWLLQWQKHAHLLLREMVAKARGQTYVLCVMPMLEHVQTEASFKKAVEQHTQPEEIDQLINGPTQHFAQAVWGGHFDAIKRRLLGFLVAPEICMGLDSASREPP